MGIEYETTTRGGGPRDLRSIRAEYELAKKRGEVKTVFIERKQERRQREQEQHQIYMAKVRKRMAELSRTL